MKIQKWIKTDFILLNEMLGNGIPVGKIIEIFGFEGCGKTTLALELSKCFSKTYYIDYEHELDENYVKGIGAKLSKLECPETFEEGIDNFFHSLKKNEKYDLLIIDTIGSAITNEQIEKDLKDNTIGSLSQKVTIFLRKAEKILKPMGITLILLNHKKDKIGIGFGGERYYTPGGRQIKYSSSIRLSITQKKDKIFDDGIISNIWCVRNKVAQGDYLRNCEYIIVRGKGIIKGEEGLRLGTELNIVKRQGQSFVIGKKSFRGKKEVIEFINSNDKIRMFINDRWNTRIKNK